MEIDFDKKLQDFSDSTYILGEIKGLLESIDIIAKHGNQSSQIIRDLAKDLSNNPLVKESLKNKGILI